LLIWAAREAGFGNADGTSTNKVMSVIANRLMHDKDVLAAIAEYSRGAVRAISPEAVRAVRALIRNDKHRDHMRAVAAVLDRVDPPEIKQTVAIEDHRQPTPEMTQKVLDRIDELMQRAGLPPPRRMIDVTPETERA